MFDEDIFYEAFKKAAGETFNFQKATTTTTGPTLNTADWREFISAVRDISDFLAVLRVMPMKSNAQEVHTLTISTGQAQAGTEATQATTGSTGVISNTCTAFELVNDFPFSYQYLEDNVWTQAQGPDDLDGAVEEALALLRDDILIYTANELTREAASSASSGISSNNSFIDLALSDSNVVDISLGVTGSAGDLSGSFNTYLNTASLGLPDAAQKDMEMNPSEYRYIGSRHHADQFRAYKADKTPDLAFELEQNGGRLLHHGVEFMWVPGWPDNHILLSKVGPRGNLVLGVRKNMKLETDRDIKLGQIDNVWRSRQGFQFARSNEVVLLTFVI